MKIVVSLHDVHPSSLQAVARQRADLRAIGINKVSLLVVPQWHGGESVESDLEFIATITRWQNEGDEVVLHGWTHSCSGLAEGAANWFWTHLYTNQEAEFLVLPAAETKIRLDAGRAVFERCGWNAVGFIAPAWLMAAHTVPILRELGFAYTVTRKSILSLSGPTTFESTSLCYSTRSGWRRTSSLLWNQSLATKLRSHPLLRLSLHPGDVAYPKIWDQILRLTRQAMAANRVPRTYRDCVSSPITSSESFTSSLHPTHT